MQACLTRQTSLPYAIALANARKLFTLAIIPAFRVGAWRARTGGTNPLMFRTRCLSPFTCRRFANSIGLPAWGTGIRGGSPSTWCANAAAAAGAGMTRSIR